MVADHQKNDRTQSYSSIPQGTVFSHYRIIQMIGMGGMGEVYQAEDTELGRKVALKFMPQQFLSDVDAQARFEREAQAAAALNHPNIVTIHEVAKYKGRPFFAMELIEGPSLRDLIRQEELPLNRVFEVAVQVGEALREAHDAKVVHRDIKPANILTVISNRPIFSSTKKVECGWLISGWPASPAGAN